MTPQKTDHRFSRRSILGAFTALPATLALPAGAFAAYSRPEKAAVGLALVEQRILELNALMNEHIGPDETWNIWFCSDARGTDVRATHYGRTDPRFKRIVLDLVKVRS
ncbi:hypothetical protein [Mesorhizobium helmanticense]|uniref:Uncharacterized protein n=1 Tax=Mesorhizobium helmanticense TaxID=1776423 RepID=A0A2T4IP16_9HYPH|nr:hypothetical protein [Mesorhizobium helmanticense]PTE07387.1 hypothetical protein C9427_27190 [Mesorhizobium helmanticense]